MASSSKGLEDGANTIRFIMLEANLNDGNLAQIAQAITNAVRQNVAPPAARLISSPSQSASVGNRSRQTDAEVEVGLVDDANIEIEDDSTSAPARVTRTRSVPKPPEVIPDLDLTGDVSFVDFARQVNPQKDRKRFLTVATWFKRYKQQDHVTINHVYTCYRTMKWPYSIEDYDGVFRALKTRKLVSRKATGQYAINQLGEAEVDGVGSP
jgi:uncharacterized protein YjhX (UPF0386 family)